MRKQYGREITAVGVIQKENARADICYDISYSFFSRYKIKCITSSRRKSVANLGYSQGKEEIKIKELVLTAI